MRTMRDNMCNNYYAHDFLPKNWLERGSNRAGESTHIGVSCAT